MKKIEQSPVPLATIRNYLIPSFSGTSKKYVVILLFLTISSLSGLVEPLIYGRIVDELIGGVQGEVGDLFMATLPLLGLWIGCDLLQGATREGANLLSWKVADTVWGHFWKVTLGRVLSWDPQRFTMLPAGALAKQLDNAGNAVWRVSGTTLQRVVPMVLTAVVFIIGGMMFDWRMTLASLAGIPLLFFMVFVAQRAVEKKQDAMSEAWENFLQKFVEILANIVPIQSFGAEDRMAQMHMHIGDEAMLRQRRVNALWALLSFSTSFARFFARFILLTVGVWLIAREEITIGVLISFMGMLDIVLSPFEHMLSDLMRSMSETRSAFARVLPELMKENLIQSPETPKKLRGIRGELTFDHVGYRYPEKDEDALIDINLEIPAGKSLAIVGRSGSGKSTLVKFINRFLDPTTGRVLFDGRDIREFSLQDVRKNIGFVHQESVLFNESLYENIRFAKPRATRREVEEACKKAQAHEFISRLPDGYDTVIGERGVRLSGGERQRIAIARVLLANQPILVLDESTSALDSETEFALQEALKKAMEGRTTIIIAHRLSTIYMADAIAVLERGKVVEYGNHEELLTRKGVYERLWSMQSGGYITELSSLE